MTAFHFYTKLDQTMLLGVRARTVQGLLEGMRTVPDSSIYHHTHRYLRQHHYLSPEPPNDFAYWITDVVGDDALGEQLASVDIIRFESIAALRGRFVGILDAYVDSVDRVVLAPHGEEFHFMASRTFVMPTPYIAHDLREFLDIIGRISFHSLYYHIFDAKLRLGYEENDFSYWFRSNGYEALADELRSLDPYTYTLNGLQKRIIVIARKYDTH